MSKDVSQVLTFAYYFSHIMLSRKYIQLNKSPSKYLHNAYRTACHYSFEMLISMISLSAKFVRGSPAFQMNQMVYACITLFDFLGFMPPAEKKRSLSLITQSYWHLNQIGEKMNDATETISGIIRKLADMANNNQVFEYEQKIGSVGQGSITEEFNRKLKRKHKQNNQKDQNSESNDNNSFLSQQQQQLSTDDLPLSEIRSAGSSPASFSQSSFTNQISLANEYPSSLKLLGHYGLGSGAETPTSGVSIAGNLVSSMPQRHFLNPQNVVVSPSNSTQQPSPLTLAL
ncbi:unnamed protein product [Ambrosiozyma monospora]|uniref:Unnamed protein product n=1 Tax=Ambrosiozyma monospora TaxID=43982 RepID=A0ACB5U2Q9_AMBMO|nr:unnamed protein product [Ambrosiozyma monospora]